MKKLLYIFCVVGCLLLLIPGVTLPVLDLSNKTMIDAKIKSFNIEGTAKRRSILGTVKELYKDKRYLVSIAIFSFSIVIPFFKMLMIFIYAMSSNLKVKSFAAKVVHPISKWSMADVFVVALFLVFLSTNGVGSSKEFEFSMLGLSLPVVVTSTVQASLLPGFYCFLAYCICSNLLTHFVDKDIVHKFRLN